MLKLLWNRIWAALSFDYNADWDRRFEAGENPEPSEPGGPASNAW